MSPHHSIWSALIALAMIAAPITGTAQALEGIIVETYYVQPRATDTLTTYRIYVDLADRYALQMVFGSEYHRLKLETTTDFFNDTVSGVKFADRLNAELLKTAPLAQDSWLTIAAASDAHLGVPRELDTDGSLLRTAPYKKGPLGERDGLLAAKVKEVVTFKMDPGYLHNIRGGTILTVDGAWAVLGGVKDVTPGNKILIAQLTTTGTLSYQLNVQVGAPDGRMLRYVAQDPRGEEILFEGLSNGRR